MLRHHRIIAITATSHLNLDESLEFRLFLSQNDRPLRPPAAVSKQTVRFFTCHVQHFVDAISSSVISSPGHLVVCIIRRRTFHRQHRNTEMSEQAIMLKPQTDASRPSRNWTSLHQSSSSGASSMVCGESRRSATWSMSSS